MATKKSPEVFPMGTYNLLPHQKELLRFLVKNYQDTEGEEYEYFVRAAVNGEVAISGSSESYYVGDKYSLADFEKLVSLELLDRGRQALFYRVSPASVEAVENDFEYLDPPVAGSSNVNVGGDAGNVTVAGRDIVFGELHDCKYCKGTGEVEVKCTTCGGTGEGPWFGVLSYDRAGRPNLRSSEPLECETCNGQGTLTEICSHCKGQGQIRI